MKWELTAENINDEIVMKTRFNLGLWIILLGINIIMKRTDVTRFYNGVSSLNNVIYKNFVRK